MAMTYDEAVRRLGRRTSVLIDKRRGTEFRRAPGEAGDHGDIQVRYRGTPVVTFHPDQTYTLRTGGHASKTVIRRIAEYSPISLVRRGNGFFIEDIERGRLTPFLEGTRVDSQGGIVRDAEAGPLLPEAPQASQAPHARMVARGAPGTGTGTGAGTTLAIDEARLRAYVRRVVLEVMGEQVMPAGDLRPVRARVVATPAAAPPAEDARGANVSTSASVPLTMIEKLLLSEPGLDKAKAQRMIKDLRNAFRRGRRSGSEADDSVEEDVGGAGVPIAEAADADVQIPTGPKCRECDTALVLHYDRANRYRGCDYALEHSHEPVELIK